MEYCLKAFVLINENTIFIIVYNYTLQNPLFILNGKRTEQFPINLTQVRNLGFKFKDIFTWISPF